MAIGIIFSVPTLLDNIQAQTNATNPAAQAGQAAAQGGQNATAQAGQAAAQGGQNATAQGGQAAAQGGQNQTLSPSTQALQTLGIANLRANLMDAKDALANGDIEEGLTGVTNIENELLLSQNTTTVTGDFQKIKESISKRDLAKALDDITNVQKELIKAETEVFKVQIANPELITGQDDEDEDEEDDGDNN